MANRRERRELRRKFAAAPVRRRMEVLKATAEARIMRDQVRAAQPDMEKYRAMIALVQARIKGYAEGRGIAFAQAWQELSAQETEGSGVMLLAAAAYEWLSEEYRFNNG